MPVSTRSSKRNDKETPSSSRKPEVRVDGKIVSPEHVEKVRQAAWRMMDEATARPLPTTEPLTVNARIEYYSQTWCPIGCAAAGLEP